MGKIQILPEHLANQIAAGEVVERPASIVKELVENSVDAGASQIDIEIEQGGIQKIVVTDNGSGMDEDDLQKSVLRHGTSKIQSEEDLQRIRSMGFRGEALASIGAVSRLEIKSRQADQSAGKSLVVEYGKEMPLKSVGMPQGTHVVVEHLFDNVPARKKFLRSAATEMRYISEVVEQQALGNPVIGFRLKHNGKSVLDVAGGQTPRQRVAGLFPELSDQLLEVQYDHPHLQIHGWVGKPQIAVTSRATQMVLVNRRAVQDRLIAKAVKEGFGSLLMTRAQPVFVLYIELPHEMVDVNVHPRKQEVRFVNSNSIFMAVKQAVEAGLKRGDLTYVLGKNVEHRIENREEGKDSRFKILDSRNEGGFSEGRFRDTYSQAMKSSGRDFQIKEPSGSYQADAFKSFAESQQQWLSEVTTSSATKQEIIQIFNLYLITQSEEGMVVVDQHAAHERILYEKFLESFNSKQNPQQRQQLLVPVSLKFSAGVQSMFDEYREDLQRVGFEFEEQDATWQVVAVPALLSNRNIERLLQEMLGDLQDQEQVKEIDSQSHRMVTFLACRSAIKGGDPLTQMERQRLLEDLAACKLEYTCPHGRPITIVISERELEKMFKRVV